LENINGAGLPETDQVKSSAKSDSRTTVPLSGELSGLANSGWSGSYTGNRKTR